MQVTDRPEPYRTASSWLTLSRGSGLVTKPVQRLKIDETFRREVFEWLSSEFSDLATVSIQVFGNHERPLKSWVQIIREDFGTVCVLYCGLLVEGDEPANYIAENIVMLRVVEDVLRRLRLKLNMATPVPSVTMLDEESLWLQQHGEPVIPRGALRVEFVEKGIPQTRANRPKPYFDVWQLFPGGVADPVAHFIESYGKLPKALRDQAAAAVRWYIDAYLSVLGDALEGCVTDGAAIQAAALLCGGPDVWDLVAGDADRAVDLWPADTDAEQILDITQWA